MPIHRRRRIFRAGPLAPSRRGLGLRPTLAAGVLAVLVAGGIVLLLLPATLFGRVPAGSDSLTVAAAAVAVVDGETLRLDDRVVRLRGVLAPPRGRVCRRGDGAAFDCGAAAADGLARLVGDRDVTCRLAGRDRSGFPQGTCRAGGADLNRAMIAGGWARAEPGTPALAAAEAEARAGARGLWAASAF